MAVVEMKGKEDMAVVETQIDASAYFTLHTVHGVMTKKEILTIVDNYYQGTVTQCILWNYVDLQSLLRFPQKMSECWQVSQRNIARRDLAERPHLFSGDWSTMGLEECFRYKRDER